MIRRAEGRRVDVDVEEEVTQTSLSGSLLGTWGRVCVWGAD